MRTSTIVMATTAGLAGFFVARLVSDMRAADRPHARHRVRQAGPEHMSNPPRRWGVVDEMSDESFPASDPPGVY